MNSLPNTWRSKQTWIKCRIVTKISLLGTLLKYCFILITCSFANKDKSMPGGIIRNPLAGDLTVEMTIHALQEMIHWGDFAVLLSKPIKLPIKSNRTPGLFFLLQIQSKMLFHSLRHFCSTYQAALFFGAWPWRHNAPMLHCWGFMMRKIVTVRC